MQISSIVDIVGGKLLNNPSISFIYTFKTNAKKIKEGDLFVATNQEDIPLAVKNGAFAILVDKKCDIIDNEISWIKVPNLQIALIKFIRYKLALYDLEVYHCNKAVYDLIKLYAQSCKKNIITIPNDLNKFLSILDDITQKSIIIYYIKDILDSIYPNNKQLHQKEKFHIDNLTEHSLFETSFSYHNQYYQRAKIPSLYIEDFIFTQKVLGTHLDLSKLKQFYNFNPIFLDKNINLVDYGKSDRFLICQKNELLAQKEINFLEKKYNYAKILYITSEKYDFIKDEQIILKDIEKLKSTLKKIDFNAVYILGFNYTDIHNSLTKEENGLSLF